MCVGGGRTPHPRALRRGRLPEAIQAFHEEMGPDGTRSVFSPPELAPLRFKLAGLLARGGPETLKWRRTPSNRSFLVGVLNKEQPILSSLGTVYRSRSRFLAFSCIFGLFYYSSASVLEIVRGMRRISTWSFVLQYKQNYARHNWPEIFLRGE